MKKRIFKISALCIILAAIISYVSCKSTKVEKKDCCSDKNNCCEEVEVPDCCADTQL